MLDAAAAEHEGSRDVPLVRFGHKKRALRSHFEEEHIQKKRRDSYLATADEQKPTHEALLTNQSISTITNTYLRCVAFALGTCRCRNWWKQAGWERRARWRLPRWLRRWWKTAKQR